jgi:hypothetical protein
VDADPVLALKMNANPCGYRSGSKSRLCVKKLKKFPKANKMLNFCENNATFTIFIPYNSFYTFYA